MEWVRDGFGNEESNEKTGIIFFFNFSKELEKGLVQGMGQGMVKEIKKRIDYGMSQ